MKTREPTEEEAHKLFKAVESIMLLIPEVCERHTNVSLSGFISVLYSRLTFTSLDSGVLDMERIHDAIDTGRSAYLISQQPTSSELN